MKAIRIHDYGSAAVLRYEDVPLPKPGSGEVLVRTIAAGVNPIDWKVRAGYLKTMVPLSLPWTPGGDFSGVVESVGSDVSDVSAVHVGDEVFGRSDLPHDGSYAQYVAVPAASLAKKPRTLNHVQAAGVPLAALTAWQALFGMQGVRALEPSAGQTLLILGAAGGVGSFAVQFAKWKGARVIATARPSQAAYVRGLGADVVLDAKPLRLDEAGQVDAVLDLVGGDLQKLAFAQLKRGGSLASTMGAPSAAEAEARGARTVAVSTRTNATQLAEIGELIDAGKVKVHAAEIVPLESARHAHEVLEAGGVLGKVVISVAT